MNANTKTTPKIAVLSWALYDLANTTFSLNIVSLHFALWVVNDMGGKDQHYVYANVASMILVVITAPMLGVMSDQAKRRMPFLVVSTILCVLFTFLLGLGGLVVSLAMFIAANYMFQSGLIFYDSLLPSVSNESNRGKVGSFGVGLGYIGSLIAASSGLILLSVVGRVGMFKITAVLFLIFAIPCFIWVKDANPGKLLIDPKAILGSFGQMKRTIVKTRQFPGLSRFFIGRIFYTDAVNTLIILMSIYVTNELGFTDEEAQLILMVAILFSIMGTIVWGLIVDNIGPKRCLNLVLYIWMIVLTGVSLIPLLNLPGSLIWVVAAMAGIAMGGTWCADRPYLLRLVPKEYAGEFFGVYSMVGRFATIAGPLIWVFVADILGLGRPLAVLALLVLVIISYFILRGVSDSPRTFPDSLTNRPAQLP